MKLSTWFGLASPLRLQLILLESVIPWNPHAVYYTNSDEN